MISLTAATGLIDAIAAGGGDPDAVLSSLGLTRQAISNPMGVIPSSDFARLLEAAALGTHDACFGLHFAERYQPKNIGPVTYVVLNSPTFAAGIENVARYLHAHNEAARVTFALEGDRAYVRHELADLSIEVPRQHNEYSLAVGLNTIRLMAGSRWAPMEVQFAHAAPADLSEHVRVFRAPVSFGCPTNAFVVEREFLDRPVPAADERLYPILRRYLDRVLKDMPREEGLLVAVRRAIGEAMRDGDPALAHVAKKLAASPRTLQRQLKDHGLEFKRLVDDTRHRFSLNYLRDRKHTLTEIAFLLGYSEVSAFNRAFKRWTGSTPSDYRKKPSR
jgi:AraC-like DNA-binding protein